MDLAPPDNGAMFVWEVTVDQNDPRLAKPRLSAFDPSDSVRDRRLSVWKARRRWEDWLEIEGYSRPTGITDRSGTKAPILCSNVEAY